MMENLQVQMENLQAQIENIGKNLQAQMENLQAQIKKMEENLQTQIEDIQEDVDEIRVRIKKHDKEIARLKFERSKEKLNTRESYRSYTISNAGALFDKEELIGNWKI